MFKDNPFKDNPILSEYYNKMMEMFSNTQTKTSHEEEATQSAVDYSNFKVSELKAEAKSRGLKGYTKLKKSELVDLLNKN